MAVRWIETTEAVYFAIYGQHCAQLRVHGTISHIDHPDYGYHMMTEWGLPGADEPLIKIDTRGLVDKPERVRSYFLACVTHDDES